MSHAEWELLFELIELEAQIAAREAVHQSPSQDWYRRKEELRQMLVMGES